MKYSKKEKERAIQLYKKLGNITKTVRRLGYPSRHMLYDWIDEYESTGTFTDKRCKRGATPTYTQEEIDRAITFYYSYGKGLKSAANVLGYPSAGTLGRWVKSAQNPQSRDGLQNKKMLQYTSESVVKAAAEFCSGEASLAKASEKHKLSRQQVKNASAILLGKECDSGVRSDNNRNNDPDIQSLIQEKDSLIQERDELLRQIHYLQMERDALEIAGNLLKKVGGINLKEISNREKTIVIDALRSKYRLKELLPLFHISKSSYCYQRSALRAPGKDAKFTETVKTIFTDNHEEYGYRRIHAVLKKQGTCLSEKRVRRIMREEKLAVHRKKSAKFNSYKGELTPAVPNIINRNFHADKPNEKWLTDITEFSIPAGKVYLSPIIDCFDGMPVSWRIGTSPNAELANSMLDEAAKTLQNNEHPIVHSDRGSHYRWPGWIDRMEQYGLTRSMSKKGCSPDNSACEGFFGILKNAMFYGRDWKDVSVKEFIVGLDDYLHWFREKRIKKKLGYKSPIDYRASLGIPFSMNAVHCQG